MYSVCLVIRCVIRGPLAVRSLPSLEYLTCFLDLFLTLSPSSGLTSRPPASCLQFRLFFLVCCQVAAPSLDGKVHGDGHQLFQSFTMRFASTSPFCILFCRNFEPVQHHCRMVWYKRSQELWNLTDLGVNAGSTFSAVTLRNALVSCGCCNKLLQPVWLKTKETYSPTVLEAKRLKSMCWQSCTPDRGSGHPAFLSLQTHHSSLWLCGHNAFSHSLCVFSSV